MDPKHLRSLLLVLSFSGATRAQADCVFPATGGEPFAVGDAPLVIDIGDLDGDGSLDIVASNFNSTDISVLLGNGDGSFAEQAVYDAPSGTYGVAIADLDEDGNLDILTSNESGTISVFLGNGDGTFGPNTTFPAGGTLRHLDVGDLNNDGDLDVAVADLSGPVTVLLGNGDGTLSGAQPFSVSRELGFTSDVAIADLDGDGNADLVVARVYEFIEPHAVFVLLGDGTGNFPVSIPYIAGGEAPQRIQVDDLNNDTVPDVSTSNIHSHTMSVLLGSGDGTLGLATAFDAGVNGPQGHDVGDVDGDGDLDIVVPGSFSLTVGILSGNGDGTFQPAVEIPSGSLPQMARLGDFDGVGELDLAVVAPLSNVVLITLNACPCGNGVRDAGEICDGEPCCSPACTYKASGTICRASQGSCDPFEEVCSGTSELCPADVVLPAGTVCAPAASTCAIDGVCDGNGPVCPGATIIVDCADDCPASSLCNANNDNDCDPTCGNAVIEAGEDCDGGECCNRQCAFAAAGFACRDSQGPCDVVEYCIGDSVVCPPDEFQDSATVCDPATEPCELDNFCDGLGPQCPPPTHICDDGNACTEDVCIGDMCSNTDVNGLSCTSNVDCTGPTVASASCQAGFCVCPGADTRAFMTAAGSDPNAAAVTGATSVHMEPGSTIDIEVFFQDPFDIDHINAYQLIFPWFASGGDSGTVSYVNINPGMSGGNSVTIDKANPDWVFINSPAAAGLPSFFNETPPTIFGVIYNYLPGSEVPVCGPSCNVPHCCLPNYIAQFSLTASPDASGVFTFPFHTTGAQPFTAIFNHFASYGGGSGGVTFQPLEITVGPCLSSHTPCADADDNGLRDDSCTWWECDAATCVSTAIPFADIGGANGACPPDLTVDANDRFHALNCFSNIDTMGNALAYPCEDSPPGATNVDAGGAFGACCPDGVCDGNDAFHTLHAFVGDSPCQCPANFVCPCPAPTAGNCIGNKLQSCTSDDDCGGENCNLVLCPPGPGPLAPEEDWPRVTGRTAIKLVPRRATVAPGGVVEVDVFLMDALADLRGYQLHVTTAGGKRGRLDIVDLAVEDRADQALSGPGGWRAFNTSTGQMLAGLDTPGVGVAAGAYLATLTFQASKDAAGRFSVDLLHDDTDPAQRTFLFPSPPGAKIEVESTVAAVVTVARPHFVRRVLPTRVPQD